jgi:hypothetical protein
MNREAVRDPWVLHPPTVNWEYVPYASRYVEPQSATR